MGEFLGGEPQPAKRHLHARLKVVAAKVLELRQHFAIFAQQLLLAQPSMSIAAIGTLVVNGRFKLMHPRFKLMEARYAAKGVLEKRLLGSVRFGMLPGRAYPWLFLNDKLSVVHGELAQDDLEKSGFPGTIRSDYANPFALVYTECYIREDILEAVSDRYVLKV